MIFIVTGAIDREEGEHIINMLNLTNGALQYLQIERKNNEKVHLQHVENLVVYEVQSILVLLRCHSRYDWECADLSFVVNHKCLSTRRSRSKWQNTIMKSSQGASTVTQSYWSSLQSWYVTSIMLYPWPRMKEFEEFIPCLR